MFVYRTVNLKAYTVIENTWKMCDFYAINTNIKPYQQKENPGDFCLLILF